MKKYSAINLVLFNTLLIMSPLVCGGENNLSARSSPSTAISAEIIEIQADHGIDIDNDQLFEFLTLDVEIVVSVSGEYSLMGFLYSLHNQELAWSIDHRNLSVGSHVMHLDFCGKSIEMHGVNGPYRIKSISLLANSSDKDLVVCDELMKSYITSKYNYSEFSNHNY